MARGNLRGDRGFTVTELMVVVLILGILVAVTISSYLLASERALRIACLSNQRAYLLAVQRFAAANNTAYPDSLGDLREMGFIGPRHRPNCPKGPSTPYIYDPDTGGISCPTHPLSP